MNLFAIGNYIQLKRKEKNLTQEQLAEILGVSNKTISKWENGKSLPDFSLVELLCKTLGITSSELFNGEDNNNLDEKQLIEMLDRIQKLENQKNIIFGILLIILGISCFSISHFIGGSDPKDFFSGFLVGISIGTMLIGVFVTVYSLSKK